MKKILILLICLMAITASATDNKKYAMDFRTDVRTLFFDESGTVLTDDVFQRLFNMRLEWFATFCGIYKVDTIVTVNNQVNYTLNYDFIASDKVAIRRYGEYQHRSLDRRGFTRTEPTLSTLGQDNKTTHPAYYSIVQIADSTFILKLDSPENESTTDTIFVYYKAQPTKITGATQAIKDSTVINVPYSGRFLVTYATYLDALMMNRENPVNQNVIPLVEKMFQQYFELYMRDYSVPEFRLSP